MLAEGRLRLLGRLDYMATGLATGQLRRPRPFSRPLAEPELGSKHEPASEIPLGPLLPDLHRSAEPVNPCRAFSHAQLPVTSTPLSRRRPVIALGGGGGLTGGLYRRVRPAARTYSRSGGN
jgi:hypothetical protein